MSKNQHYISSANYIRAFAALAVTQFHLGGKAIPILKYGWLGVEMFFVLSGFIICWSLPAYYAFPNLKTFFKKRLIRIEPPYVASIAIAIFTFYVAGETNRMTSQNILLHLGYLPNFIDVPYYNPVYWTLGIEFQFYILIGLFFHFFNKKYSKYLLLLFSIVSSILKIESQTLLTHFPFFAIGMYIFLFNRHLINLKELYIYLILISGFALSTTFSSLQVLAGGATGLLLLLQLPQYRIVDFFAKISFSLYLTHDLIGSKFVVYLGNLLPKTFEVKASIFLLGMFASIVFAYLFFLCIEKPFLKLSKKLSYANV